MDAKKIKLTDRFSMTVDLEDSEGHEEIESIKKENVHLKEELEDTKIKLKGLETLVDKLKDKVECPVCLEVPRSGPIPVCPNGHFVCKTCKKDTCPTCRARMDQGCRSLMADTVIEYIDHKCKFVDCDQSLKLADYEKHSKVCEHRTICCPAANCKREIPLSSLIGEHSAECKSIYQQKHTEQETVKLTVFNIGIPIITWKARHLVILNQNFFLNFEKSNGTFNAVMLMAGSEEECQEFVVNITIHKKLEAIDVAILKYQFCGHPCSIDVEKEKRKDWGLSVGEKAMGKLFQMSDRGHEFNLTFEIDTMNK